MSRYTAPEDGKSLTDRLESYAQSAFYPMHMPGHKRRGAAADVRLPWLMDVTEIHGFDNLHEPTDILLEMQQNAAALYGSDHAFLMVNGSTGGILSAVSACVQPGEEILIARNCHKSVYHALEIGDLIPHYIQPETNGRIPFCGSVSPDSVRSALADHPLARAVVITSPTYEGVLSDIPSIARICHERGVPLIVDSAHGAHLGFHSAFPENAVRQGADVVVQSLHKTLPALTQTAILHVSGSLVRPERVAHRLDIFETSSPSYVLLASIDACLRFLRSEGASRFAAYADRLNRFSEACASLDHLRLATRAFLQADGAAFCADLDPGKLTILCTQANLTGFDLMNRLREEAQIECEMALREETLAMTSLMDDDEGFDRLARALTAIDRTLTSVPAPALTPVPIPRRILSIREALAAESETVSWQEAKGRVAADYFWVYPPGIPWFTPGEEIPVHCPEPFPDGDQVRQVRISVCKE